MTSSSNIEEIEGIKYIVTRREDNSIICKSLYEEPDRSIISGVTLWDRFEETEQENLVDSANKKIKKFLYELRTRPSFDLKDQKLINAINALETASIIGVGRAAEILSY